MNEEQYINPLIQSMAQGFQNQRQREQLKAQTAQYAVENKQKQQSLDRLQTQLEAENEFRNKMLQAEHEQRMLEQQKYQDAHSLFLRQQAAEGVLDANTSGKDVGLGPGAGGIGAGLPPPSLAPDASSAFQGSQASGAAQSPQQGPNLPQAPPAVANILSNLNQNGTTPQQLGGGTLTNSPPPGISPPPQPVQPQSVSGPGTQQLHPAEQTLQQTGGLTDGKYIYPGPERAAQIKRLQAAAQSGGTAQGEEAFKISAEARAHGNQLSLVDQLHQNDMEKDKQHMAEEHSNQMLLEAEKARLQRDLAGLGDGFSQQVESNANAVMSGNQDFNKLTHPEQRALKTAYPNYQWPSDGKAYKQALDNYDKTNELIEEQKRLAINYSSDSPTSPSIGGHDAFGQLNKLKAQFPQSEIGNALQSFNGHSGNLAKEFDSATAGRRPEAEVKRVTAGSFDPSRPMSQNLQKTKDLEALRDTALSSVIGAMPPEQKARVLTQRGIQHDPTSGGKATVTGNLVNFPDIGLHTFKDAPTAQQAADKYNNPGAQ